MQNLLYSLYNTPGEVARLLRSNGTKKAFAFMLLIAVFAVLLQGVIHEICHELHDCSHQNSAMYSSTDHSDECHSQHQTCSSLSCSHGSLFIAETNFRWQTDQLAELLKFPDDVYRLPIIASNFFKPPIISIS